MGSNLGRLAVICQKQRNSTKRGSDGYAGWKHRATLEAPRHAGSATPREIMQEILEIAEMKPLTIAEKQRRDVLRVNEIFYSIQGESSRAGAPCVFIRMTGCGLRCTYCDTEYAFYEGEDKGMDEILDAVEAFGCKLVELTGGEPLEQEGVYALMDELLLRGYDMMIETGGHIDISRVDTRVKRIVDLKTPSSGMMKRNRYENIEQLTQHDEVKFVIGSREDYEWSRAQVWKLGLAKRAGTILFSPVIPLPLPRGGVRGEVELSELAGWILEDHLPVRLQTQLHKLIWPGILRGV
jgi:7-carboxy-7-deazaguanine synthase